MEETKLTYPYPKELVEKVGEYFIKTTESLPESTLVGLLMDFSITAEDKDYLEVIKLILKNKK